MHSKTSSGFIFFDVYYSQVRLASYSLLFLLGFSRAFGDNSLSDKLFIPSKLKDSDGSEIVISDVSLLNKLLMMMRSLGEVSLLNNGYLVDIGYIRNYLSTLGFGYGFESRLPYLLISESTPDFPEHTFKSIMDYFEENPFVDSKKSPFHYVDWDSLLNIAYGFLMGLKIMGYGSGVFNYDRSDWLVDVGGNPLPNAGLLEDCHRLLRFIHRTQLEFDVVDVGQPKYPQFELKHIDDEIFTYNKVGVLAPWLIGLTDTSEVSFGGYDIATSLTQDRPLSRHTLLDLPLDAMEATPDRPLSRHTLLDLPLDAMEATPDRPLSRHTLLGFSPIVVGVRESKAIQYNLENCTTTSSRTANLGGSVEVVLQANAGYKFKTTPYLIMGSDRITFELSENNTVARVSIQSVLAGLQVTAIAEVST